MTESCSDLKCGLTNDHVVKEPISLLCGHFICKKCFHDRIKIECKICSIETNRLELQSITESAPAIKRIKTNLDGLFDDLEKRATDEISKFKS